MTIREMLSYRDAQYLDLEQRTCIFLVEMSITIIITISQLQEVTYA